MGDKVVGGVPKIGTGRMFSMAEPQPAVLWPNGGHSWIQRVE